MVEVNQSNYVEGTEDHLVPSVLKISHYFRTIICWGNFYTAMRAQNLKQPVTVSAGAIIPH
jgi:hypothetical protein